MLSPFSRFSVAFTLLMMLCLPVACAKPDVAGVLERYLWEKRVLLVFTPDPADMRFVAQEKELREHAAMLNERDTVIWRLAAHRYATENGKLLPHIAAGPFFRYFDAPEDGFTVILLGKDGGVKLREEDAVTARRIADLIDAMPMRRREMRQRGQEEK